MKKILIVEDDPNIAASLDIRFKANGYATLIANDAVQGTRSAVQARPDLIILDISIPAGNGLTVAANLSKLPETNHVPVIFVTASKDPCLRQQVMDFKAAGFFEKPYDIEELLAVAHYTLQESSPPVHGSPSNPTDRSKWNRPRAERILIVEDDSKIAVALALRLKSAGYQTTLASDALLGLSAAVKTPPDLILLDISMPAGNGLGLAEKIHKLLAQPPPIIFLTASKQPGLRQKAEALGAAGFFEKPYEAEELLAAVQKALEKRTQKPQEQSP